jgi:hypothetical protein
LPIGLGIGRLVFRALNGVETGLAVGIVVAMAIGHPRGGVLTCFVIAIVALVVQLLAVRPRLKRRSDAVLAGRTGTRSRAHYAYVALEVVKLAALIVGGILVLLVR